MKIVAKSYDEYKDKVEMKLGLRDLDILLAYSLSSNKHLKVSYLFNLKKLIDNIDDRPFKKDLNIQVRFKLLCNILEGRLNKNIKNTHLLMKYASIKKYEEMINEIFDMVYNINIDKGEINFIKQSVNNKLSYLYIYKHKKNIINIFDKLDTGNYENYDMLINSLRTDLSTLLMKINKTKCDTDSDNTFSLIEDIFKVSVQETYNSITCSSNILKTTIQFLNIMLDGGFEGGRIYTVLGISGGFKSGTLLNLASSIRDANPNYVTLNKNKIATILYITLENSKDETVERLYSLKVSKDTDDRMKYEKDISVVYKKMKDAGLNLNEKYNIDILIKEMPVGSTALDIDGLISECEETGREIICIVTDYLKKMSSIKRTSEARLELGYIVDELKSIIKPRKIPCITATQFNRNKNEIIEQAKADNKMDLGKMLGSSGIGESWNVVENSDWICSIYRERLVSTNQVYLTFNRSKLRNGPDDTLDYFCHPFLENEFALAPDIDLPKPLSKKYLSSSMISVEGDIDDKVGSKGKTSLIDRPQINTQINLEDRFSTIG